MRKWAQLATLAVCAAIAGCGGELTPQARQLLRAAYDQYEAGEDGAATASLDEFLAENPRSKRADEAYYLRGLTRLRGGDGEGARLDLDAAVAATSNTELRSKALVALGELAFEADDLSAAESLFVQALANVEPHRAPADHAHYRLGVILQRLGRWREADVQFNRVMYFFEGSQLADLAGRRTHCAAWTIQLAAFRDKAGAEAAGEQLSGQGLDASVRATLHEGRPLFVVQAGRYETYRQAHDALEHIPGRSKATITATP